MNNDNKDQEAVSMEKWKRESSQWVHAYTYWVWGSIFLNVYSHRMANKEEKNKKQRARLNGRTRIT
jgi:hypothetical protein